MAHRFLLAALILLTSGAASVRADELNIVPWPDHATVTGGECQFNSQSRIVVRDPILLPLAQILSDDIQSVTGARLQVTQEQPRDGDISLDIDSSLKKENYQLAIDRTAQIIGANYNAVEMGTITLLQLLKANGDSITAPKLKIEDGPKLAYNGYLLNTAFRPYSIETLKRYVIYCRFNKIRYFLITLSSDNGWLFPSTAFPKLGTANWGWHGEEVPKVYDMQALKDLVAFADARGVTIVPQIQTLGHSDSMRITMPETFDGPDFPGQPAHLAMVNVCNDAVYPAMDTLVGEICDVFKSSPYFHIGCDEVNTAVIAKRPQTRQYMKNHNMTSVYQLITEHIRKMDGIVTRHGKRMLVWEPSLDYGDLPKDIIAMPWIGDSDIANGYVAHGIQFIAAPWGIDQPYQNVYNINAAHLKQGEPLLIGSTALNWASGVSDPDGVSMFSEPVYNPDANRGVEDFLNRADVVNPIADKFMFGFALRTTGVLPSTVFNSTHPIFSAEMTLALDCPRGGQVRYAVDGTPVTENSPLFTTPITLRDSTTLRAILYDADGKPGIPFTRFYKKQPFIQHDAIGAKVTLDPPNPGYFNGGAKSLTDGYLAATDTCGDEAAIGWLASPTITVELQKPTVVRTIYIHFLSCEGAVALPKLVDIQLSNDDSNFVSAVKLDEPYGVANRGWYGLKLPDPKTLQFIRVHAERSDQWVFTDELIVNADPPGPTQHNAALGKPVTVANPLDNADGNSPPIQALTDGYITTLPDPHNPEWLSFKKDLDATIDLGQPTDIRQVSAHFMQQMREGFRIPNKMTIQTSTDGKDFTTAATIETPQNKSPATVVTLSANLQNTRARYVRITAPTNGGAINVDEIEVNPDPAQ